MRYAPPPSLRIADKSGGLNQVSVRSYNERLIMSLLLQKKGMSRLELGKESGLSAQTISVIVRSLEQDGLVTRGEAQRGRVGPPTIPMSLNPDGAFSLGVSISSRVTDVVLIDFLGTVRFRRAFHYEAPDLDFTKASLAKALPNLIHSLDNDLQNRIIGMGIALPDTILSWPDGVDTARSDKGWGDFDFETFLEDLTGLPVFVQNDITAATSAESLFGEAKSLDDYLFFFLGARSHSRMVLNQRIYAGNQASGGKNRIPDVLDLEADLKRNGLDSAKLWQFEADWSVFRSNLDQWGQSCGDALIEAINELSGFIDIKRVLIAGIVPEDVQRSICNHISDELKNTVVIPASVGPLGKAVGAASLPFISRFMVQQET